MGQLSDILVPEGRDTGFIDLFMLCLAAMPVSRIGVFKSLPGLHLPGLAILFLMGFRGTAMCVGGTVVKIGGALMVLVMRSVSIASGHFTVPPVRSILGLSALFVSFGAGMEFAPWKTPVSSH